MTASPFSVPRSTLCLSCGKRKGKRQCPHLGGLICSQCCGEKRLVVYPCPHDCVHLVDAMRERMTELEGLRQREPGIYSERELLLRREHALLLLSLETAMASAREAAGLMSVEAEASLALLAQNAMTRARGVIYAERSPQPRVQALVEGLSKLVEGYVQPANAGDLGAQKLPPINWHDAADVLVSEARMANYYNSQGRGRVTYLMIVGMLTQQVREQIAKERGAPESAPPPSGLITP